MCQELKGWKRADEKTGSSSRPRGKRCASVAARCVGSESVRDIYHSRAGAVTPLLTGVALSCSSPYEALSCPVLSCPGLMKSSVLPSPFLSRARSTRDALRGSGRVRADGVMPAYHGSAFQVLMLAWY